MNVIFSHFPRHICYMNPNRSNTPTKEQRFSEMVEGNRSLMTKVCYMYASDESHFKDLYQEVLANLWQGLDSFRGESKPSTWIYRMALNTCVSYFRRHDRMNSVMTDFDSIPEITAIESDRTDNLKLMYRLISSLGKLDKALILMWLDEYSYDEIAEMSGLSRTNVAARLRRIKLKLARQAEETEL